MICLCTFISERGMHLEISRNSSNGVIQLIGRVVANTSRWGMDKSTN